MFELRSQDQGQDQEDEEEDPHLPPQHPPLLLLLNLKASLRLRCSFKSNYHIFVGTIVTAISLLLNIFYSHSCWYFGCSFLPAAVKGRLEEKILINIIAKVFRMKVFQQNLNIVSFSALSISTSSHHHQYSLKAYLDSSKLAWYFPGPHAT